MLPRKHLRLGLPCGRQPPLLPQLLRSCPVVTSHAVHLIPLAVNLLEQLVPALLQLLNLENDMGSIDNLIVISVRVALNSKIHLWTSRPHLALMDPMVLTWP